MRVLFFILIVTGPTQADFLDKVVHGMIKANQKMQPTFSLIKKGGETVFSHLKRGVDTVQRVNDQVGQMILPRGLKGPNFEQRAKRFLSFIVKDFYEDLGASQMKVFRARRIEYLKKFELENNKANPKFKEKPIQMTSLQHLFS